MGMSIEEARTALGKERKYALHENKQAFDIAMNTMRKYQKIKNIICKWEVGLYDDEGLCHTEVLELISDEVNGNGNVD